MIEELNVTELLKTDIMGCVIAAGGNTNCLLEPLVQISTLTVKKGIRMKYILHILFGCCNIIKGH